jgi:hypothetical protein
MQKTLLLFVIVILFLQLLPITQANELPSDKNASNYVNRLLYVYNAFVELKRIDNPNFEQEKQFYRLYNGDNSFNIICVRGDKVDNGSFICIFEPNKSSEPYVIVDFNTTMNGLITIKGSIHQNIFRVVDIRYNNIPIYPILVFTLSSEIVTTNWYDDSGNFAKHIFMIDDHEIEKHKILEEWEQYKEQYEEIIENDETLYQIQESIDYNILMNVNYTYELFLQGFQEFDNSVQNIITEEQQKVIDREREGKTFQNLVWTILFTFLISLSLFLYRNKKLKKIIKHIPKDIKKEIKEMTGDYKKNLLPWGLYGIYLMVVGFQKVEWYKFIPLIPIGLYLIIILYLYNKNIKLKSKGKNNQGNKNKNNKNK